MIGLSGLVSGMALALFPRSELAKDANVADCASAFSGFTLAYNARSREHGREPERRLPAVRDRDPDRPLELAHVEHVLRHERLDG